MNKKINSLYDHFKNTSKKLKIVCDWDEVIQPHEPYALWKAMTEWAEDETKTKVEKLQPYNEYARFNFWMGGDCKIEYSPFGSKLKKDGVLEEVWEKQQTIKNSPNFYRQAPFLTIAEDLFKLIKEDKVEQLIFLSAYDKRKFPNGDERKWKIFRETFDKFDLDFTPPWKKLTEMVLIGFDNETQGQAKVEWIHKNASDLDVLIDDNPIICGNAECAGEFWKNKLTVCAPYYPAIENQHHKEVLLINQEVSNLKKEDFKYE